METMDAPQLSPHTLVNQKYTHLEIKEYFKN